MERRLLPAVVLVLTVYLAVCLPTFAVAYTPPLGYSGKPIKYGGWLVGQVLMEISHIVQKISWAKITVTTADGTFTKTATTNGYGYYRVYLPPGEYKVTVSYARYSQTYDVTIRVDQEYRFLNVYLERPDMPEFQDRLAHK
ncbi:MAG: carboxypeptidase-like regulatory domain-containing protein [Candidatus Bathyarchaeota archaeon]|jgi:hypothetical protein|nr:carboxypeptidase-like regulatory domain-containing protein [Candidatus Bathyarchaeota archaeon]